MIFKYPLVIAIFLPIALFFIFRSHKEYSSSKKIIYPMRFREIVENFSTFVRPDLILTTLRVLMVTLAILALARPQSSQTQTKRSTQGIDIIIALDVSRSMLIEDFGNGENRINTAKQTLQKFVDGRKDDRIGFLMFSGESITLCPPTLDYDVLQNAIEAANVEQLKDGTAIGDALATAVSRLKDSKAKSRIIILLTDGDSNMGSVAPLTAGEIAQGYGIKIYSIAFGRDGVVRMPIVQNFFGQKRKTYEEIKSTINPELLQKISEASGGHFFRAAEEGSLPTIFKEIDKLEKTKVETKEKIHWDDHFEIFLWPALILLVLDFILSRTRLRVLPN